uniref:Uncharacterized protein n=1 Tax=Arundo donax TaxID=35708 RepID=A0A0A9CBC1_ARUDO
MGFNMTGFALITLFYNIICHKLFSY